MTSRNALYELKKREQGLTKKTLWIPEEYKAEFEQMAKFCVENKGCVPAMVRDTKTGRLRKAVE